MKLQTLTAEQQKLYEDNGYLLGLPQIFTEDEVKQLQAGYAHIVSLLQDDENPGDIMGWHKTSR